MNDSADLQWFTRSVLAQALTNGYCAIPIVAGPCPHPNACLNCAHFRTDATFLEVHRAELHETERVIAKAEANGWARQSEMNARKRTSLINIVTAPWRQVMVGNVEGLKRSARSRSEHATQRATAAILLMQAEEVEINFRSVAARAKVSTAWLYGTKSVRDKIAKIRNISPVTAGENLQHRQRLSHERVVATLRLRIRTLEEVNRELTEQLEDVYGTLAVVQPRLGRYTKTSRIVR